MRNTTLRSLVEQYETPEETRRNDEKDIILHASHDSDDWRRLGEAQSRRRQEAAQQLRRDIEQRATAKLAAAISAQLHAEPEMPEPVGPNITEQTAHTYARMTGKTGSSTLPPEAAAVLTRMNNTLQPPTIF